MPDSCMAIHVKDNKGIHFLSRTINILREDRGKSGLDSCMSEI